MKNMLYLICTDEGIDFWQLRENETHEVLGTAIGKDNIMQKVFNFVIKYSSARNLKRKIIRMRKGNPEMGLETFRFRQEQYKNFIQDETYFEMLKVIENARKELVPDYKKINEKVRLIPHVKTEESSPEISEEKTHGKTFIKSDGKNKSGLVIPKIIKR